MRIIKIMPLLFSVIAAGSAVAQNDVDALRYSQTGFGSTARSMSMGGAFGALGGEISSLSNNPAGIAVYKNSELTFTPTYNSQTAKGDYLGQSTTDGKLNFNFSNAGLVLTYNTDNETGWSNFNFGFAYNRLQNFNARTTFAGINNQNSLLGSFTKILNDANGGAGTDHTTIGSDAMLFAYQTFLLNPVNAVSDSNHYTNVLPNAGALQRRTDITSGAVNDLAFSFGANYESKLYMGITLGLPSVSYTSTSTFEEIDSNDKIDLFKSYKLRQDLKTTGSGINVKIGGIYRPIYWLRLGLAVHTPTVYQLTDVYSTALDANFDRTNPSNKQYQTSYSSASNTHTFNYEVTTPTKVISSAAFVIKKHALLSIDYELVDYSTMSLASTNGDYSFDKENSDIQTKYKASSNVRIGAEYKLTNMFSVRAGYAFYQSPFQTGINSGIKADRISYTAGVGMREKGYFVDLGYSLTKYQDYYQPYSIKDQSVDGAVINQSIGRVGLTVGLIF
jgi:hypothetical protein